MAPRVNSDLLLVGSLPAESTEAALRSAGGLYGDLVFALPDGETGQRAAWAFYDCISMLMVNPALEVTFPEGAPRRRALPRHLFDSPALRLRDPAAELRFDSWPRIDDAIASYQVFRALREEGVIPAGLRFQVSLPFTYSLLFNFTMSGTFADDYPVAERAFEDLVARELPRLTSHIPPSDLAVQWDVAWEPLDIEGVVPRAPIGNCAWDVDSAWERFAGPVRRLGPLVPGEALFGYHLCYGTFPDWPMYETRDMEVIVRMANYAIGHSGRDVDWVHLAGPRYMRSEDNRFFRPLQGLVTRDTRPYLGIVLPIDGEEGLRRRQATASKYLGDFGVALYCGFGRQPGEDGAQTMREHAAVVRAIRG